MVGWRPEVPMSIIREFKEFAMRGNVVDMAVGIIIGSAFGKIVTSLVNDIIMPPIGLALGGIDFKSFAITIKRATADAPAVAIGYGAFINVIVDFVIVAFVLFAIIKLMNTLKKKKEVAPPAPPKPPAEEVLLTEIRDLLKKR
jgi:large conductance mechanosensitive channel